MAAPKRRPRESRAISLAPTESFMPAKLTVPALREAAENCRGCPLYLHATQTVFGEGAALIADLELARRQAGG